MDWRVHEERTKGERQEGRRKGKERGRKERTLCVKEDKKMLDKKEECWMRRA